MTLARILLAILLPGAAGAQQYAISTIAGGVLLGPTPWPAVQTAIGSPRGIAADGAGNVYFSTWNAVFELDGNGVLKRIAGTRQAGYSGDGGPATSAQLAYPTALAIDSRGDLYIADGPRLRKVSAEGIITTVAGAANPGSLAADSAGGTYFSDGFRVHRISAAGGITTIAGDSGYGYSGDGGPAVDAQLGVVSALTASGGNLYIAECISDAEVSASQCRVRMVSPDGIITTTAWTYATALAADSAGNLYIGQGANVRMTAPSGQTTIIDGGSGFNARALAVDGGGSLYIADAEHNRIRKIANGAITTIAGNGALAFSGDGGPAECAQLQAPVGLTLDSAGNVYVADTFNERIRRIAPDGTISTIAGTGVHGFGGDGGQAAGAMAAWPAGMTFDGDGNLYFADSANGRVRRISPAGIVTTVAGAETPGYNGDGGSAIGAQLNWPESLAFDTAGNLYIVDGGSNMVRKVSRDGIVSRIAGQLAGGYSGDGGPALQAALNGPVGLAIDSAGNLYVADRDNFRVRKISSDGIITTVAGNGVRGYSGDGGPAASAQLMYPSGVAVDHAGNLFIADGASVRMVSAGIITTIAGTGELGLSGDGGLATQGQLGAWGIAIDAAGDLFISDPWNNAIRYLQPSVKIGEGFVGSRITTATNGHE